MILCPICRSNSVTLHQLYRQVYGEGNESEWRKACSSCGTILGESAGYQKRLAEFDAPYHPEGNWNNEPENRRPTRKEVDQIDVPYPCCECIKLPTCEKEGLPGANDVPCEYPMRPWYSPTLWASWFLPVTEPLKKERQARNEEKDWPKAFKVVKDLVEKVVK